MSLKDDVLLESCQVQEQHASGILLAPFFFPTTTYLGKEKIVLFLLIAKRKSNNTIYFLCLQNYPFMDYHAVVVNRLTKVWVRDPLFGHHHHYAPLSSNKKPPTSN
jgi:hypothetical protein